MASHQKKAIRACALCRGEGVGYVAFQADEACEGLRARATVSRGGAVVPCSLFKVRSTAELETIAPKASHVWVVCVPLFAFEISISLMQGAVELGDATFPALRSKVTSRMLTMTKPSVAALLRGYEIRHGAGDTSVRIAEAWPSDDGVVAWRVFVSYPTANGSSKPVLEAYDAHNNRLGGRVVCMEDQVVGDPNDATRFVRHVTFSCMLPESVRSFNVRAWLGNEQAHGGFAGMNASRASYMIDWARAAASGNANGVSYDAWFEEHRATHAELSRQRTAFETLPTEARPLFSIVTPVFRTSESHLQATIDSVLAQTYGAWELLLVNTSGPCAEVDGVLGSLHDSRVRVIEAENKSIAENTNVGIEEAEGDYVAFLNHDDVLEPDALWCFAQAICTQPEVDLLYSDEDRLQGKRVHSPAFKMGPNYGKLYAHYYVSHLLMVSRRVLEITERSGADVSGAQDYDLTLKAFEVAREVVHVPRVLYHWREHEGATSDNSVQKLFTHEAGRHALAAHLKRRSISASVEDGPLPNTYRLRYELPKQPAKVSIVIPSRDHMDLLNACVTSILKRTTYKNYEIVIVENNSTQDETFGLYDDLRQRDERVRVTRWASAVPGEFNYSAIVNHGVRQATGEFVVLLNNDTEVIESRWIEKMLGCLTRPEVGVVGAKLLYEDGLTQHVLLTVNPNGDFLHSCQNLKRNALGPGYAAAMPGDVTMVTGACQMIRRSLYDLLGGYDEKLAVGFNDGDFCLRVIDEGYVVTVAPDAVLLHREFSSRGRDTNDVLQRARYVAEKAYVMGAHPEFFAEGDTAVVNPNLDRFSPYLSL